jgi:NTP pyrophosphatase (non-canonical NTP hydrolase)
MSNNSIADIFIKEALKTESPITPELINRLTKPRTIRLLHASMGMVTEAGELLDALKKFIFYGKDLDLVNIKEELGDSNWYQAVMLDEIGNSYEEIWAMVIKKLRARHGDEYSAERVVNRDLNNERKILESSSGFEELFKSITRNVKMEIVDSPITHWLADVDTLAVTCNNMQAGDKYTLDINLLTCHACRSRLLEAAHA